MYYESNYLSHHGVKGMKWGVRHDPERKGRRPRKRFPESGGYKHKAAVGEEPNQRKGLTPKQKKILIAAGVTAAAGVLAFYGGRKVSQLNSAAKNGIAATYERAGNLHMDKAYRHDKEASNIWNEYDQVRLRNARNGDHDFWNLPEMKNIAARGHAAENRSSHEYNVATEFYNKAKAKDYPLRDKVSYIKTGGTLKVPKTNPEYMRYTFDTGSAWYEKNKHLFI